MFVTPRALASLVATCLTLAGGPTGAQTFDCTITGYSNGPYSRAALIGLLPERQRHVVSGASAEWIGVAGEVTTDTATRLKWRYYAVLEQESGMVATIHYVLLRNSNKLILSVLPGGAVQPDARIDSPGFRFVREVDDTGALGHVPVNHVAGRCVSVG